jgi:hypothetical protein
MPRPDDAVVDERIILDELLADSRDVKPLGTPFDRDPS